jgi:nitroreductase
MISATAVADRPPADVLIEAAGAAGHAPSILNTQPWRWRVQANRLDLFAERSRQLTTGDLFGRLLMLSCGAALHHARVALAAQGWKVDVTRLPDQDDPDLLATLVVTGRTSVTAQAMRQAEAIPVRHTDRRPVKDEPMSTSALSAIEAAANAEARLQILASGQVLEVAAAAGRAAVVEAADPYIVQELAYWTGRCGPEGTGMPADVILDHQPQTTVPARDFGRHGSLPAGVGHDRSAVYALLYGDGDEPADWLRAGEALSAAWLTATTLGVSLVPLSGVIELTSTRTTIRSLLADLGHPYLVLRLGIANPEPAGMAHTPRLPTAQLIEASPVHRSPAAPR